MAEESKRARKTKQQEQQVLHTTEMSEILWNELNYALRTTNEKRRKKKSVKS